MRFVDRFLDLAWALLMGLAILLTARLTYAETLAQRNTIEALQRAIELDRFAPPAEYFEHLAVLTPDHSAQWLSAALQTDPRLSSAWIQRGLEDESNGALRKAEADLLQAASVDHQYLPAWTLANFYFREKRPAEFWSWAGRAAQLTYDDFRPLLALAHAVEADPQTVIAKLGGGKRLMEADLEYLAGQGRLDQAQTEARMLLALKSAAEAPRILELTERQIRAGRARDAMELWNGLGPPDASSPDASPLDPYGRAVTNGDFLSAPSGAAFDWSLPQGQGFSSHWRIGNLTVLLSGDQPESCALLEQIVPLDPARRYRLQYEYVTSGLTAPTGLAWDLDGAQDVTIQPAAAWQNAEAMVGLDRVLRPAGPALSTLRLRYSRAPGTLRAQGQIQLRRFRLEAL